ncbi:MAG: threonine synthase [Halobacteriales archaeon]
MPFDLEASGDEIPRVATEGCWLACIGCGAAHPPFAHPTYTCPDCGGLLEVRYAEAFALADATDAPGVWRYREALPLDAGVSLPEGGTPMHEAPALASDLGLADLRVKHEGMNPTGSFKDRGMTVGVAVARRLGVERLACASTGNTAAALAAYGARGGLETLVVLPAGKVAAGKLAQASLHGARILEVDGSFDDCLELVRGLAEREVVYLLNSLNPFRLEGQKTIGFEVLEAARAAWGRPPDRVVLPVGNAGNVAALFKAWRELVRGGDLAPAAMPRLTGVQAAGAAPFVEAVAAGRDHVDPWADVETAATAIRIGHPVNAPKALPGIYATGGTTVAVDDAAIQRAQRDLAAAGIGVEPASAASLAGLRELRERGEVDPDERVVCLTTGHLLKDPDAAAAAGSTPASVPNDLDALLAHLGVAT